MMNMKSLKSRNSWSPHHAKNMPPVFRKGVLESEAVDNGDARNCTINSSTRATRTMPYREILGRTNDPALSLTSGRNGIAVSFSNAAMPPVIGAQFTYTASGPGANFPIQAGVNIGNAAVTMTGAYSSPGNPTVVVMAAQLDANNNVVGAQVATAGDATLVVSDGDRYSFTPASVSLTNDLGQSEKVMSMLSGVEAHYGAQTNATQADTSRLRNQSASLKASLPQTVDTDYAALATKMATAQTLDRSALAVVSKSIEPSLIDCLR
jgi:flagellin-like hook-associated protein FlgL